MNLLNLISPLLTSEHSMINQLLKFKLLKFNMTIQTYL
jgi:hypothetical protein